MIVSVNTKIKEAIRHRTARPATDDKLRSIDFGSHHPKSESFKKEEEMRKRTYERIANGLLSKKLSEEELRKVISELYEQVGTFDSLVWTVVRPTDENWAEFYFGAKDVEDPKPELYIENPFNCSRDYERGVRIWSEGRRDFLCRKILAAWEGDG